MNAGTRLRIATRQLAVLTGKELRQLVRDRVLLGFTIYIFSLHILVTTIGASDDLRRAPVLVHDGDRSAESRELTRRLRPPYFTVTGEASSPAEGPRALDDGTARVFVDLPEDFSERLGRSDEKASVQVLVDTSKVSLGYLASSYASRIAEGYGQDVAIRRLARAGISGAPPRIESRERTWYNFVLDTHWAFSLQSLLMMMSVACVMLPATAAVREKERGTIEQLLVSPVSPLQVMLAKVVSMILVSIVGSLLAVYGVLQPVFGVPMRGSPVLFFAMVALFAYALGGLGLVLATLARTSAQVGLLVILTVMPMINLSGVSTPLESMPPAMQYAVQALPLYHFVHIAYGITLRGEGLATLWPSALAMTGIGTVFLALGLSRFRRQLM